MVNPTDFESLFIRIVDNACSSEEVDQFISILTSEEVDNVLLKHIESKLSVPKESLDDGTRERLQNILQNILSITRKQEQLQENQNYIYGKFWKYITAASFALIIAGACVYLIFNSRSRSSNISPQQIALKNDILPGGNKAILTLANGTHIILDSADNGQVANLGSSSVIRINKGLLSYNPLRSNRAVTNSNQYNTLTTPKGGQYQLELSDGTKVWLNAASSIRYPTSFAGVAIRKVEVTGEAYFEIAKDAKQPFQVKVGDMQVDVLGTSFNIEAYKDEPTIKTTLLEGGVRITEGTNTQILNPGEQSQLTQNGQMKLVKHVDLDGTIAWKNGYFSFDQADLQTVMLKIARWYNVRVFYQGDMLKQRFGGEIQQNLTLSQVLTILGKSQINFRIEGNTLTIYSNK